MATSQLRLRGTYNSIDTDVVNLPIVRLRGLPFGNWRELGLGFLLPFSRNTDAEVEVSYQAVDLYDMTESGAALSAGISHKINHRFAAALRVTYFDIRSADWRITWDLYTTLTQQIDLLTRIDDTSEFDFTWYEIGLRFRF